MRLRTFILAASTVVAVAFFAVGYYAVERVLERTVRENARAATDAMAETTFASMYQVMSTGWTRAQAESFLRAVEHAAGPSAPAVRIYRGPVVAADYGDISQPPLDDALRGVLETGQPVTEAPAGSVRHLKPMIADPRCLDCHAAARAGSVLGVIEVHQDFAPLVARARRDFFGWLLFVAPVLIGVTGLVVWQVNRRIENAIATLDRATADIGKVADLSKLEFLDRDLGFDELNRLFDNLGTLVGKLRGIAVDKDVLKFEIGLLEKFVITSEVVRDWGDYIARLLADINTVMPTHVMFSVFRVDDEMFDLEIFWSRPPTQETKAMMEHHVRAVVAEDQRLSGLAQVTLHHHAPPGADLLELDHRSVVLETKSLILEQPRIGGIVGIGVHTSAAGDDTLRLVMDSILSTMLNVVGSVKAIHKYTRDMEYYATRDPLTDLYNRRVFWELFEYEVARAKRQGYSFGLLVIDLDNFKLVNDGYGHATGDRYLQAFAETLRHALRPGDILARYGGDEFIVLLPDVVQETAVAIAQRMLTAITGLRISHEGQMISGSASMGLAVFPLHAENAKDLFLFADSMMYKAKTAGKNQLGIPSSDDIAAAYRDMTETTLMVVKAVNEGRIEPWFQPIMDLQNNRQIGVEVLSRLSLDDEHIEAARFIEYAEKAGVIHRLDTLVMEKALRTVKARGYEGLVFINLSPRALALAGFMHTLKQVVSECDIEPGRIVFEITERDTVKNMLTLERLVGELKLSGFKLAIDDFGSGFSSFQYLRRLPVDFVKIEGDFVLNMTRSEKDMAFVRTIRQLAAGLNIPVVAEHVESEEVGALLRDMGVEMAQGYHFGRPARELALPTNDDAPAA